MMARNRGARNLYPSVEALMDTGRVRYDLGKSAWITAMSVVGFVGAPFVATRGSVALFAVSTAVTLCAGHSVGIHRGLIHRAYRAPRWLEHTLAYLGTLVGLGHPLGLLAMHNARDAQQNEPACHDYFAHRRAWWLDYFWNVHCRFEFDGDFAPRRDPQLERDGFYRFLARTWRLQQLPWALLFAWLGGVSWVVWGICLRVAVSTTGHWLVGYFAHRSGAQTHVNEGAAVQGFNVRLFGALSMGEGWHNNHHTWPRSARMGIEPGQLDPGWMLLCALRWLGLVTEVLEPSEVTRASHARRLETKRPQVLRPEASR